MNVIFKRRFQKKQTLKYSIIALIALTVIFIGVVIYRTYEVYKNDLPSFTALHNIEPSLKTKIYASDGVLLQEYFSENRVLTPYKEMPPHLINMLVAVEDREFFNHWGLNTRRIFGAILIDIAHWEFAQGASTITQQLSRMLFLNRKQTIERKIKEALTAIKLERTYSKEEIIQMYLNEYYFGWGAYGIAAAARTYFNKRPMELSIGDCAFLVGLLKGPSRYSANVFEDTAAAKRVRDRSLYAYYDWGRITEEEYDSLKALPMEFTPPAEQVGRAPYFTEEIRRYLLDKYGEKALYSGGLTVYSTLNWHIQQVAEIQVKEQIAGIQKRIEGIYNRSNPSYNAYTFFLPDTVDSNGDSIRVYKQIQGAAVSIENSTGNVLALVGGKSFEDTKWNRATQSTLTPGSSFKPFVYTAAMDNGFNPSDLFYDNSIKLKIPGAKDWRPHNFDDEFMGEMTLRDALRLSRNLVAIKLLLRIGPEQAIFYAQKMGITTPLRANPSLAIGTSEVRPIEMVSAYTVFPNGGIKVPYRMITKIVDRYGNVIEDNSAIQKEEVLSAQTAYIMVNMMQSVIDNGTGRRVRWLGFTRPAGGKTGTSDSFCDNWFVGYTPQITSGVWVGFDDKTSIGYNQTGATNALPIWAEIMKAAHDSLPIMDFEVPEGIVFADICLESGKLATDRCINVRKEIYREESVPTEPCNIHPSTKMYEGTGTPATKLDIPEDTTDVYHF